MNRLGDYQWVVYVLPGFVALFVASFISDFPHIRDVQLPIVYVALTALSLIIPLATIHIFGKISGNCYEFSSIFRNKRFLTSVFAWSIILGFLFGIAHTTNYVSRLLRTVFGNDLILTSSHSELIRTLFQNSYNENFLDGHPHISEERKSARNRYARFRFAETGREYEGVIASYFGGQHRPQVYLTPACSVVDNQIIPIAGPGVWLDLAGIQEIQFIYDVCSPCAGILEITAGNAPSDQCPFDFMEATIKTESETTD